MRVLALFATFVACAHGASIAAFINNCNAKGNAAQASANAYKAKTEAGVARLTAQAALIMDVVDDIKDAFDSLKALKDSISVNQANRALVISKITQQMTNLRNQMNSKVMACKKFRQAAADVRKNAKAAITKVNDVFTAWADVVENALNRLEQRFKGKPVFAALHTAVKDTVEEFADTVHTHEVAITAIRKSFSAFEADADAAIDAAQARAEQFAAQMNP